MARSGQSRALGVVGSSSDSPLEGAGFELPVPRAMQRGFPCTPRQTAGFSIQEDEIPPETDCLQDGTKVRRLPAGGDGIRTSSTRAR